VLILGVALCLVGFLLLRIAIAEGRRAGLFSSTFWTTFAEFARYRLKRLWPALPGIAGAILLIWGLVLLFQWLLAYYTARMGHPLG
jgi:peptidoglycan/LPS O-acetylase OafA/YrhL